MNPDFSPHLRRYCSNVTSKISRESAEATALPYFLDNNLGWRHCAPRCLVSPCCFQCNRFLVGY